MIFEIAAIISAAGGCYAAARKLRGSRVEVRCAYCATPVSGDGKNCVNCGAPAPEPPKPIREYSEDPWLMP